jgi:hypothetical protein
MKICLLLFCALLEYSVGFTEYQNAIVRRQLIDHKAPPGAVIVDGLLTNGDLAFTNQQQMTCHIDAARFQCCPNSFANTIIHEIHHLHQRQHNSAVVKDDPMSYSVTTKKSGELVNDNYVLPPLNPAQPWARQIPGVVAPQVLIPAPGLAPTMRRMAGMMPQAKPIGQPLPAIVILPSAAATLAKPTYIPLPTKIVDAEVVVANATSNDTRG